MLRTVTFLAVGWTLQAKLVDDRDGLDEEFLESSVQEVPSNEPSNEDDAQPDRETAMTGTDAAQMLLPGEFQRRQREAEIAEQQLHGAEQVLEKNVGNLENVADLAKMVSQETSAQVAREEAILAHDQDALEEAKAADAVAVIKQADVFFRLKEAEELDQAKRTIQQLQDVSFKATEVAKSMKLLAETQALDTNKQVTDAKQIIQQSWFVAVKAEQVAKSAKLQAAAWVVEAEAASARATSGAEVTPESKEEADDEVYNEARTIAAKRGNSDATVRRLEANAVKTQNKIKSQEAAYDNSMDVIFAGISPEKVKAAKAKGVLASLPKDVTERAFRDVYPGLSLDASQLAAPKRPAADTLGLESAVKPGESVAEMLQTDHSYPPDALKHRLKAAHFKRKQESQLAKQNLATMKQEAKRAEAQELAMRERSEEELWSQKQNGIKRDIQQIEDKKAEILRQRRATQEARRVALSTAVEADQLQAESKLATANAESKAVRALALARSKSASSKELPAAVAAARRSVRRVARQAKKANRLRQSKKSEEAATARYQQRLAAEAEQLRELDGEEAAKVAQMEHAKTEEAARLSTLLKQEEGILDEANAARRDREAAENEAIDDRNQRYKQKFKATQAAYKAAAGIGAPQL